MRPIATFQSWVTVVIAGSAAGFQLGPDRASSFGVYMSTADPAT